MENSMDPTNKIEQTEEERLEAQNEKSRAIIEQARKEIAEAKAALALIEEEEKAAAAAENASVTPPSPTPPVPPAAPRAAGVPRPLVPPSFTTADSEKKKKEATSGRVLQPEVLPPLPTSEPSSAEAKAEIKKLPEEDKERLGWGLRVIGYKVEKMKDDFFAAVFDPKTDKLLSRIDKKGTLGRFCSELRESFVRDSKEANKKGLDIQEGRSKGKLKQVGNIGLLAGNVLKYGRIVADIMGTTIANPLRWTMLGGMVAGRVAEAGKEARFKSDKLLEKTQIKDADLAAEEAWNIYVNAGGARNGGYDAATGNFEDYEGGKGISAEALKDAYLRQMPEDMQKRLENPTVALNFVQKITRKQIEFSLGRLQGKMENIVRFRRSPEEIKKEEQKLLKKWEKDLKDYDRMITQYGTVDELAMGARYAQKVAKGVVLAMQIETAYKSIMNVPKLWDNLSHMLTHSNTAPTSGGISSWLSAHNPFGHGLQKLPDGSYGKFDEHGKLIEHLDSKGKQIFDLKGPKPPGLPSDYEKISQAKIPPISHEMREINPDAIIHKGQGIEHIRLQIEHNPKLAQELGFKGNINDAKALHDFSGREAHRLAIKMGYVSKDGQEIRVRGADKVAYEIDHDEHGKIIINERTVADGRIVETHHEGDTFEKGDQIQKEYEYKYAGNKGVAPHEKITGANPQTGLEQEPPEPRATTPGDPNFKPAGVEYPKEPTPSGSNTEEMVRLRRELIARMEKGDAETMQQAAVVASKGLGGNTIFYDTNVARIRGEDLRNAGFVVTAKSPGGADIVYNTNSQDIRMGGGEHFRQLTGLSHEQSELINHHPEFASNPFHLPPPRLMEVYDVHQKNLSLMFNHSKGMEMWNDMKGMSARELLDNKNPDPNNPLIAYLHKIIDVTKIKPQGGIFKRPETVDEMLARGMQKAAQLGRLRDVRM